MSAKRVSFTEAMGRPPMSSPQQDSARGWRQLVARTGRMVPDADPVDVLRTVWALRFGRHPVNAETVRARLRAKGQLHDGEQPASKPTRGRSRFSDF